jgi:hypothetical protein
VGSCQTARLGRACQRGHACRCGSADSLWVFEGFLTANTLGGVKHEKLLQEVESETRGVGVERLEWYTGFDREGADVTGIHQRMSRRTCSIGSLLGTW